MWRTKGLQLMDIDKTILMDLSFHSSARQVGILETQTVIFLKHYLGLNGITLPVSFYLIDIPITIKGAYCG